MYLAEDPKKSGVDLVGMEDSAHRTLKIALVLELIIALFFVPQLLRGSTMIGSRSPRPEDVSLTSTNTLPAVAILSFMALIGLGVLFGMALPDYIKSGQLAESSQSIQANITGVYSKSESKGQYATYSFSVSGAFYNGRTDYEGGYGDRGMITVYYLPSDPSFSALNPEGKRRSTVFALIFLGLWNTVICTVLGFVLVRFARR